MAKLEEKFPFSSMNPDGCYELETRKMIKENIFLLMVFHLYGIRLGVEFKFKIGRSLIIHRT